MASEQDRTLAHIKDVFNQDTASYDSPTRQSGEQFDGVVATNETESMMTTGQSDAGSAVLGNYQPKSLRAEQSRHKDEAFNMQADNGEFDGQTDNIPRKNFTAQSHGESEIVENTGKDDNGTAMLGNFQPKILQHAASSQGNIGIRDGQPEPPTTGRYIKRTSYRRKAPPRTTDVRQHSLENKTEHFRNSFENVVNGIEGVSLASDMPLKRPGMRTITNQEVDYDETELKLDFTAENSSPPAVATRPWKSVYEGEDFAQYLIEEDDVEDAKAQFTSKTKKQSHKPVSKTTNSGKLGTSMMDFLRVTSPGVNNGSPQFDPKRNMKTFSFADSKMGRTDISSDTYLNRTLPRLVNKTDHSSFGSLEADSYVNTHEINYESYLTYRRTNSKFVHGSVERKNSDSGNETSDDSAKNTVHKRKNNDNINNLEIQSPGIVYDAFNSHPIVFGKQSLWKKLTLRFKKRRLTSDMEIPIDTEMTYHSMKVY